MSGAERGCEVSALSMRARMMETKSFIVARAAYNVADMGISER